MAAPGSDINAFLRSCLEWTFGQQPPTAAQEEALASSERVDEAALRAVCDKLLHFGSSSCRAHEALLLDVLFHLTCSLSTAAGASRARQVVSAGALDAVEAVLVRASGAGLDNAEVLVSASMACVILVNVTVHLASQQDNAPCGQPPDLWVMSAGGVRALAATATRLATAVTSGACGHPPSFWMSFVDPPFRLLCLPCSRDTESKANIARDGRLVAAATAMLDAIAAAEPPGSTPCAVRPPLPRS